MQRDILRFERGQYDLVVVGGGINGAAITNISAASGLKVALLEKGDFASGTSSKSTKLIHGGIRYLEHFEFDLVHESLKERFIQLKSVPHLVKPLMFIIPVYKNDKRPLWMIKLGVWLYDFLSGKYKIGDSWNLSAQELLSLEPSLKKDNLLGAVVYYDAQMDDARLCLENVLSADQRSAHIANYVEVREFLKENGKVVGVKAWDRLGKKAINIRAQKVVCCSGAWTNELLKIEHTASRKRVRLTKGVHIVYSGRLTKDAVLLNSVQDNRIFFVIPWFNSSLIGTTDTDYIGNPDSVQANKADIQYLLERVKQYFPDSDIRKEKIITSFAGLRPLLRRGGSPSDVSRRHVIMESFSGVFWVIGGKYTTYRKIAMDCINRVLKSLKGPGAAPVKMDTISIHRSRGRPIVTDSYPLYGSGEISETAQAAADRSGLPLKSVEYLMGKYGIRYRDIFKLTETHPELKNPICTCSPVIAAQIVYSIATEMAQTPEDIIDRRLGLKYLQCSTKSCQKYICEIIEKNYKVRGTRL